MKTIFVTASLPMMIRNIVRSGLLSMIADQAKVVLLCPFSEESVGKIACHENVAIERLPFDRRWLGRLGQFIWLSMQKRRLMKSNVFDRLYFSSKYMRKHYVWRYFASSVLGSADQFGLVSKLGKQLWQSAWRGNRQFERLFRKYSPSAVWSTHPFLESEWPVLWHAQIRDIPLIASIHSWDNISSRGPLFFPFRKILVWSDLMKRDIIRSRPLFTHDQIEVVGAPQHDFFQDHSNILSRADFFRQNGLDPLRSLILYAGGGSSLPDESVYISNIISAMEDGRLTKPSQIWVRFYGDEAFSKSLSIVENRQNVFWERASSEFWGAFRIERDLRDGSDLQHYINLLKWCDVVVCGPSTVSLDAAILDRPIVNVCYDSEDTRHFWLSIRRLYFENTHYQQVTTSGAVRISLDSNELISHINDYLLDPSQENRPRQRLVKKICGDVDGRARSRITEAILKTVNN